MDFNSFVHNTNVIVIVLPTCKTMSVILPLPLLLLWTWLRVLEVERKRKRIMFCIFICLNNFKNKWLHSNVQTVFFFSLWNSQVILIFITSQLVSLSARQTNTVKQIFVFCLGCKWSYIMFTVVSSRSLFRYMYCANIVI